MSAVQARLVRALIAQADGAELVAADSHDWHSATFTGARHAIRLRADAAARAQLVALAPDGLRLPGQLVAELVVAVEPSAPALLRLDVLTLETR